MPVGIKPTARIKGFDLTLFFLDGDSCPVADILPFARHGIEKGGLSAVRVANKSKPYRPVRFVNLIGFGILLCFEYGANAVLMTACAASGGTGYIQYSARQLLRTPVRLFILAVVMADAFKKLLAGKLVFFTQLFLALDIGFFLVLIHELNGGGIAFAQGERVAAQVQLHRVAHRRKFNKPHLRTGREPHIGELPKQYFVGDIHTPYACAFSDLQHIKMFSFHWINLSLWGLNHPRYPSTDYT